MNNHGQHQGKQKKEEEEEEMEMESKPQITEDKETVSEPLYEEDIIDGFSICSFKDYNDLEKMAKWSELHNGKFPDPYARLKLEEEVAKREREEREAKEAALAAEKKPT